MLLCNYYISTDIAGVSDVYFRRIFNSIYRITPLKYINDMRIKHACELLKSNLYTINEISEKSGFYDAKYFSTVFKKIWDYLRHNINVCQIKKININDI